MLGRGPEQRSKGNETMITQLELKTLSVNGVDLHYIERGQGHAVVFVHGGTTDFRSWISQIEPFAQRYRVVAYSRRYHFPNGGAEQAAEYLAAEHRDDLAGLVRALHLAPAHMVASSYGAFISLLVAREYPELVRSLVLGEPPVPMLLGAEAVRAMGEQVQPSREAFARGDGEEAVRVFIERVVGKGGLDRFPPAARQMILDNAPEFKLEVNSPPSRYFGEFSAEDARAIGIPTLLLEGESSPEFLHRMTDALARSLPNVERATIPHASHGMHNQNPQGYNDAVLAFLARH